MLETLPEYYSRLKPFEARFREGVPILMYHKVGARPGGVRFRGLYLSPPVFRRQICELSEAGYQAISLSQVLQSSRPARSIAITFDDGFSNVLQNAVAPLAEFNFKAIQFIVTNFVGQNNEWDVRNGEVPEPLMNAEEIRQWIAAGHEIGSHTRCHCRLPRLSLRDAEEEITASKKFLEDTFGVAIRHFCYPYGDFNPAIEDLVARAGYETACGSQIGVNGPQISPYGLRRYLARYPSRRLKNLREGFSLFRLS